MSDRAQHLVSIDLAAPETWPHEVWRAFEKASHQRTADNIQGNHNRSHEGNKQVHRSTSSRVEAGTEYRSGTELGGHTHEQVESWFDPSPAERIAEHTGRTEFLR